MSRQELADHLGLMVESVSEWERGESVPSKSNLDLLSKWFAEEIPYDLVKIDSCIGERIRQRRVEWGISIGDLADILGVDRSLVSSWENGKAVPHSGRLKRLSEWFAEDIPNGLVKRDESISGRLRKRRVEWGVTQLELAERLGVSESTVSA